MRMAVDHDGGAGGMRTAPRSPPALTSMISYDLLRCASRLPARMPAMIALRCASGMARNCLLPLRLRALGRETPCSRGRPCIGHRRGPARCAGRAMVGDVRIGQQRQAGRCGELGADQEIAIAGDPEYGDAGIADGAQRVDDLLVEGRAMSSSPAQYSNRSPSSIVAARLRRVLLQEIEKRLRSCAAARPADAGRKQKAQPFPIAPLCRGDQLDIASCACLAWRSDHFRFFDDHVFHRHVGVHAAARGFTALILSTTSVPSITLPNTQ